jgi:hypothetical protein
MSFGVSAEVDEGLQGKSISTLASPDLRVRRGGGSLRHITAVLFAAVAIVSSSLAAQQAPPAKPAGALPAGWKAHLDDAAAAPDSVHVVAEKESMTFSGGPAGIYYKPDMKAEKGYTVSAAFSQLKPTPQPQPYGLFIAGTDLDKAPHYTALLIRSDGRYSIVSFPGGPDGKPRTIVNWTPAAAMADPKGVKTSNTLTIRAMQDAVHFLIAEREVHQMPRAAAGGDGIAGIRIGPGLNVQVDKFEIKKFP